MKIGAAIRLIAANTAIFVGLLLALLFFMSLAGDTVNFAKTFFPKNDERADLPAYQDHEKARRIYRDLRVSDSRYVPFTEWRQPQYKSENLNIDENGYRLHTVGTDNDANAQTLGFYGSSTVWGTGVDDDNTLPAQFDKITRQFTVKNYGERGYTSMQNLIDLLTQINTNRAPRNVVFYGGLNDITVHCNLALTTRLNSHGTETRIQGALDRTANRHYVYNNVIAPMISLVSNVVANGKDARIPGCSDNPKRAEEVAELMAKNFEMMHTLVTSYGGRFHLFLQPSAYFGKPRLDYLDLSDDGFKFEKAQANAVIPIVIAKLNQHGTDWFTDIRDTLDGNEYLLLDHAHASPAGNALLAQKVKTVIEQLSIE
jgi:lysophospholipase L1-like esterase